MEVRGAILAEALLASTAVTLGVWAITAILPVGVHATLVGFVFLGATWWLVWRHDDDRVLRAGLALGGLVMPGRLRPAELARETAIALGWALAIAAVVALPYFLVWRLWWRPKLAFSLNMPAGELFGETLSQIAVIALPEEAFYRGYLQSRLDEAFEPRWRVLGAQIGPGLVASAAIFAFGHVATVHLPTRLAVFFPALLFGWLRARSGGVGASVVLHALCNVGEQVLGRGFGVY
jgi:CAAX protease family protein